MKYLRPRSADSGLSTVLLVSADELDNLIRAVNEHMRSVDQKPEWRKLKAELETAGKAL